MKIGPSTIAVVGYDRNLPVGDPGSLKLFAGRGGWLQTCLVGVTRGVR